MASSPPPKDPVIDSRILMSWVKSVANYRCCFISQYKYKVSKVSVFVRNSEIGMMEIFNPDDRILKFGFDKNLIV